MQDGEDGISYAKQHPPQLFRWLALFAIEQPKKLFAIERQRVAACAARESKGDNETKRKLELGEWRAPAPYVV